MVQVERRRLRFETPADAVADAENLLRGGYGRLGSWSLGQCCRHLAVFLRLSVDGFPSVPLAVCVRPIMKRLLLPSLLRRDRIERRLPTLPILLPPADADDGAGVEGLRGAFARFEGAETLHPSPLFGPLSRDQWRDIHLWHAEHHLGFLVPASAGTVG